MHASLKLMDKRVQQALKLLKLLLVDTMVAIQYT